MDQNNRQLRVVLDKLTKARFKSPTVASLLFVRCSLPLLTLIGILGVLLLVAVKASISAITLVVGICLGAALRDLGTARRAVRLWPIHHELFDWKKIETLTQELADKP